MLLSSNVRLLWTIAYFWAVRFALGLLVWGGGYILVHGQDTLRTLLNDPNPVAALINAFTAPIASVPLGALCMFAWMCVSLWISIMTIHYREDQYISLPTAFSTAQQMWMSILVWAGIYGIFSLIALKLPMPLPLSMATLATPYFSMPLPLGIIPVCFVLFYLPAVLRSPYHTPVTQFLAAVQMLWKSLLLTIGAGIIYAAACALTALAWLEYQHTIYGLLATVAIFHLLSVKKDFFRAYVSQKTLQTVLQKSR